MEECAAKKRRTGLSTSKFITKRNNLDYSLPLCSPFKQCKCIYNSNIEDGSSDSEDRNLLLFARDALESLPEAERDRVFNDLYGTADAVQESEDFVCEKLVQLDAAIDEIPLQEKANYMLAIEQDDVQGTGYVRSLKFRLMFLRAEAFDTCKAAKRLCTFFTIKKELFGVGKLCHRIVQDDLDENDKEALYSGGLFVAKRIDHNNRTALFFRRQKYVFAHITNLLRAWFYYVLSSLEDDNEAQKAGVLFILYAVGNLNDKQHLKSISKYMRTLNNLLTRVLPYRISTVHHCYDSFTLVGFLLKIQEAFNAARYHSHFGSHGHCRREMIQFGIRLDLFPVDQRGEYDMRMLLRTLEKRRDKEQKQQYISDCSNTSPCMLSDHTDDYDAYEEDSSLGSY